MNLLVSNDYYKHIEAFEKSPAYKNYELTRLISGNEDSVVFEASNIRSGEKFAIKINLRSTNQQEGRILRNIHHPHIINMISDYTLNNISCLVLEYAPYGDLHSYIQSKILLSETEAKSIFAQVVSGLGYAHSHKICHRDLKPDNILLLDDNRVAIADWEFATKFSHRKPIKHNCGSLHGSPPEIWNSKKYVGPEGDMWSLGVLLYAMVMGYYPFQADNVEDIIYLITEGHFQTSHQWSDDLTDLIEGLLEINIKRRYTLKDVINHNWIKYNQSPTASRYVGFSDKENQPLNLNLSNLRSDHPQESSYQSGRSKKAKLARRLSPRSMWKALTNKRASNT